MHSKMTRHLQRTGVYVCNGSAMELRLIEQGCGCSMVRDECRLKVHARRCLWHSDEQSLLAESGTCKMVVLPLQRSRHGQRRLVGQACDQLLVRSRWRPTQGACSSLPLALVLESAGREDQAPAGGLPVQRSCQVAVSTVPLARLFVAVPGSDDFLQVCVNRCAWPKVVIACAKPAWPRASPGPNELVLFHSNMLLALAAATYSSLTE